MKIRVIKGFGLYKPGQVFDWPRPMCRLLLARGVIEEFVDPVAVESAAVEPEVEVAAETKKPTRRKK